uniref:RNA-directed DNA polymerase n=1 Tax=Ixodes ricinus TaxID=34613 RepID=A0A6B0VHI3_IXORI
MSFSGLAPPPPFLPAPGRPAVAWPQWLRMFETFLLASGASDFTPECRKALLLHSLGLEGQRIFFSLPPSSDASSTVPPAVAAATAKTTEDSGKTSTALSAYDQAVAVLTQHFASASNVVVERHRFRRRVQQPGESVLEYVAALRELATRCSFAALEDSLRDQFLEGIGSQHLRERLLLEGSALSFSRAVLLAQQLEQAAQEVREFTPSQVQRVTSNDNQRRPMPTQPRSSFRRQPSPPASNRPPPRRDSAVSRASRTAGQGQRSRDHRRSVSPKRSRGSPNSPSFCFRCGSRRHRASSSRCPAQDQRCFHCGRRGHFRSVCNKRQHSSALAVAEVDCHYSSDDDEVLSVLSVTGRARTGIFIDVFVDDKPLAFLLDSGSSVSILADSHFKKYFAAESLLSAPRVKLFDYSKQPIPVRGCFSAQVMFKGRAARLLFYVVLQGTSLLGIDAIKALDLHIEGSTLRCFETTSVPAAGETDQPSATQIVPVPPRLPKTLASEFGSLFAPGLGLAKGYIHKVKVRTTVPPVASKLRRLPLSLRPQVSAELCRLESLDVIERVNASERVSPIVVVKKKDGGIQLCVDLRKPNKAVVTDSFPLPHAEELLNSLAGATHFSKLDLESAYHQVLLHPDSRDLTAFVTHDGLFRFKRICFGLASAPAAFQQMMSRILQGCPGVLFYIDDIIVFGKSEQEHLVNLTTVLRRIKTAGLKLNAKCVFCVKELSFLGHKVTAEGISPLPEKVDSILNTPAPTDAAELRSFLGLVEYYAKFVPCLADVLEPMRVLLRKNQPFIWSDAVDASFRKIKFVLASSKVLQMFDASLPVIVSTDASDIGLGAVLQQLDGHRLRTIAFASRTLSPAERKYAVGEREALACVWACEHWHTYLWGRPFTLRTDHQALVSLLSSQGSGRRPLRIARWSERLLRYNYTVEYRKGSENQVADALSRLPVSALQEDVSFDEEVVALVAPLCLTKEQFEQSLCEDVTLEQVKGYVTSSWPPQKSLSDELKPFFTVREELSVVDNLLLRGERLVVPRALTPQVIGTAHEAHPGIVRTKARLRERFWWPGMDKQVEAAIQNCSICQSADKTAKTAATPLQPVPLPERPWQKIAIDIVGPMERAPQDCKYTPSL